MQPVREALPYSYQSWIVVYILQDSTGKINIFLPDLTIFLPPSALLYLPPAVRVPRPRARVTFGRSDLPAFLFCASGGPISSSSGRNGGKNAAKTNGFWNSFHPIAVAVQKGSATNRLCVYPRCRWHGTQRAMVALPFGRLSNRALAASGGKCRCGPLGRAPERGTFLLKINQRVAAGGA